MDDIVKLLYKVFIHSLLYVIKPDNNIEKEWMNEWMIKVNMHKIPLDEIK